MLKKLVNHTLIQTRASKGNLNYKAIGQVLIYPQIGLAYNRVRKSANSSIVMYLADALRDNHIAPLGHNFKSKNLANEEYKIKSYDYCEKLDRLTFCELNRMIKHMYWFTAVRNPYTRLLSAFLDKGLRSQHGNIEYEKIPGFNRLDASGFSTFVSFLENDGLYQNKHWWPQVDLLYLSAKDYSCIAKVESLDKDLTHILQAVNLSKIDTRKFSRPHPENHAGNTSSNTSMITNATKKLDLYYNEALYDRVHKLYQLDFDHLSYSKNPSQLD
jgi:hypothetical protein